ncbi:hypothetical protein [Pseudidiomarina insulisalsae]|uniref:Capsule assembly Wzi family protein n=1 Tax=Pseudidiomarina insulisalsae TaxID=575789 RepID=A0A432YNV4_9GAMM|nr:hypothetical protein [Pseudidiomarina insulisalsae]RUO62623.1 hypothetical protein CWI71_04105 [Pseudidiomarina insulisalsae]
MRRLLAAVALCSGLVSFSASVQATPWLDAEELHVRHSLQVLADAGLLSAPVTTFPVMWRPLIADLEAINPDQLTELQQVAYYKLMALLSYHKGGSYTGLRLAGVTDTGAQPSYSRPMEGNASAAITHEQIGEHVAGRLRATYRDSSLSLNPRVETENLSWQGSYAAAMIGDVMVSADQLETWWSPGSAHDGLHTVSTLPLRGVRSIYAPSGDNALSSFSFAAFYGESEERFLLDPATQNWQREEAYGARLGWRALERLELGLHYTASELADTSDNWVFDARLSLPLQLNFYGSISEHDVNGLSANGHMVGLDWSFSEPAKLSRVYAEYDRSDLRSLLTLGYATFANNGLGYDFRIQDTRVRRHHNAYGMAARWQLKPEYRPGIERIQQVEAVVFFPLGFNSIAEVGLQGWKETHVDGREDEFGNIIASFEVRW